jgi:hypothetical protein
MSVWPIDNPAYFAGGRGLGGVGLRVRRRKSKPWTCRRRTNVAQRRCCRSMRLWRWSVCARSATHWLKPQKSTQVVAEQLGPITALLQRQGIRPIITSDRWYSCAPFLLTTADLEADKLLRVKRNRVFYRAAPPPTGKPGAPCKDGERFQCSDPATHGEPDEQWQGEDEQGHVVEVACWKGLPQVQARQIELTVVRVIRHGASDRERDPRESWDDGTGSDLLPLREVPTGDIQRSSHEHGYRFDKQAFLPSGLKVRIGLHGLNIN